MQGENVFKIKETYLVLDKVLVDFNGMPLFFVCKNEENYYIALSVADDGEEYFVMPTTLGQLSKMLHANISMRALILQSKFYWDVVTGDTLEEDCVEYKSIDEIPLDVLPYEDADLKITTDDLKQYMHAIDAVLYAENFWEFIPQNTPGDHDSSVSHHLQEIQIPATNNLFTQYIPLIVYGEVVETPTFTLAEKQNEKIPIDTAHHTNMILAA